jgi:hypothetical protein
MCIAFVSTCLLEFLRLIIVRENNIIYKRNIYWEVMLLHREPSSERAADKISDITKGLQIKLVT